MKLLIVGVGALGGVVGARLLANGISPVFAARNESSAAVLRAKGLHVFGVGEEVTLHAPEVYALDDISPSQFDVLLLATKADDALAASARCVKKLSPKGTLLPIQNGAVAELLAIKHPDIHVLGGLSNLGTVMHAPGVYEQRNFGHLLIGELFGGHSRRSDEIKVLLNKGIEVKTTSNMKGAIWSKLLINCSVTTLGAISGMTMREYLNFTEGRILFDKTYDEALSVALKSGVEPEKMIVDPLPPPDRELWIQSILTFYGNLKSSMLQDFEQGRPTEVNYINGYVCEQGEKWGLTTPFNAALTKLARSIEKKEIEPNIALFKRVLEGKI